MAHDEIRVYDICIGVCLFLTISLLLTATESLIRYNNTSDDGDIFNEALRDELKSTYVVNFLCALFTGIALVLAMYLRMVKLFSIMER